MNIFSIELVEEKIKSLKNQKKELNDQIGSLKNYRMELLRNTIKNVWVVYKIDNDVTTFIAYFLSEKEAKEYIKLDWKCEKVGKVNDPILYQLYKKGFYSD